MTTPLIAPVAVPLQFDVTLHSHTTAADVQQLLQSTASANSDQQHNNSNSANAADAAPAASLTLPSPTIRFSVPASTPHHVSSLSAALQRFVFEQLVSQSTASSLRYLATEMHADAEEEALKLAYAKVLMREHEARSVNGEAQKLDASQTTNNDHTPQTNTAAMAGTSMLSQWKRAYAAPTTSTTRTAGLTTLSPPTTTASRIRAKREPIGQIVRKLLMLLRMQSAATSVAGALAAAGADAATMDACSNIDAVALLHSSAPASLSSAALTSMDSPLIALYNLLRSYSAELLVLLNRRAKAFQQLRATQAKEMEAVCLTAATDSDVSTHVDVDSTTIADDGDDAVATASAATRPPTTPTASASTAALSDAISTLVQSHLLQTSKLEDEWDAVLSTFRRRQRRKVRAFVVDTYDAEKDRAETATAAMRTAMIARKLRDSPAATTTKSGKEKSKTTSDASTAAVKQLSEADILLSLIRPFSSAAGAASDAESRVLRTAPMPTFRVQTGVQTNENENDEAIEKSKHKDDTPNDKSVRSGKETSNTATADSHASSAPAIVTDPSFSPSSPLPHPPFPLLPSSLLASSLVIVGSPANGPANRIAVHLVAQPLFLPINESMLKNTATTAGTTAVTGTSQSTTTGSAASTSAATTSAAVASSPLLSASLFAQHLDSMYGGICGAEHGLSATILPHHTDPLLLAGRRDSSNTSGNDDSDESSSADESGSEEVPSTRTDAAPALHSNGSPRSNGNDYSTAHTLREARQHHYAVSNLYVRSLLDVTEATQDMLEDEVDKQVEKIKRALQTQVKSVNQQAAVAESVNSRDRTVAASTPLQLQHGDAIITTHGHLVTAQLCFHVYVAPRRGGSSGGNVDNDAAATNGYAFSDTSSVSGVSMTPSEIAQQHTIFRTLSHIVSLSTAHQIRCLSLPLIWDNVLLSMWSISGSYVGFGWRDAEALLATAEAENDPQAARIRANRSEELDVYHCMCRYLESQFRQLKQCLQHLEPQATLQHVVLFLPTVGASGFAYGSDAESMHLEHASGGAGASASSKHPFLGKCKMIFNDVFQ